MTTRKSFTITWRIKNFSFSWHRDQEELPSPSFQLDGMQGNTWKLLLYPRASKSKEDGFIACYLYRENEKKDDPNEVEIYYDLSVLGCNGVPLENIPFTKFSMRGMNWSLPLLLQQNTVFLEMRDAFLPKDILTIRCRIRPIIQENVNPQQFFATTRIDVEKAILLGVVKKIDAWQFNESKRYYIKFISTPSTLPLIFMNIKVASLGPPCVEIKQAYSELMKFCKCKLYITDNTGKDIFYGEDEFLFHLDLIPLDQDTPVWIFPLIPSSKNKNYDPESCPEMNNLTLRCEIEYSTGIVSKNVENVCYPINMFETACRIKEKRHAFRINEKLPSLEADLLTLMQNADYCDIKLQTKNKTFPAHRNILSARSLFFRNKLADKKEKVDIIYVEDLEIDILNQMLLFLYTDNIENLELKNAMKLYIASARYGIPSLQHKCSSFLQNYLDASNCCDALKAADQYQDSDLKKAAQNYILEHGDEVIGSDKWQDLENLTEVVEELMYLKRKKELGK